MPQEPPTGPPAQEDDFVATVRRWVDFGGTWRVVARSSTTLTVSLCRCDGGEEAHRMSTDSPAVLAHLAHWSHSD